MLLGRLEKDGSRKVGIYFDLPLSHPLCDCCVSLPFASHLLSCHVFLFFFFCFTFFFCHSLLLLYVGVSDSQTRTEAFLQHVSCMFWHCSTVMDQKNTLLYCSLCFLLSLTVPAAHCTMWYLRVFYSPQIHNTVFFIPPTWETHCVNCVVRVLWICYIHTVHSTVAVYYCKVAVYNTTDGS